jgi:TPP-dependent 2-oxoacid decarboxylase
MNNSPLVSVGTYLGLRLVQAGMKDFFTVPGDFTLVLLDQLLKVPDLRMINCCNELNAGYAADGYARETGFSMAVVTYTVGGLSMLNAVAGAFAENLSLLAVSGGPNTNDSPEHYKTHHTLGEYNIYHQEQCYAPAVKAVCAIRHLEDAARMIDDAIKVCLIEKKPVYLEIACNLAGQLIPAPTDSFLENFSFKAKSDERALNAAVAAAASRINAAVKPILIAGVDIRTADASESFLQLAKKMESAVVTTPDAKGIVPEDLATFIGTYWPDVSSPPSCSAIVESSDCQIMTGVQLTDYTTTGRADLYKKESSIKIGKNSISMPEGYFANVQMSDFLAALATKVAKNDDSMQEFLRLKVDSPVIPPASPTDKLSLEELRRQIQAILTGDTTLLIETGDSWFNGQLMHLPKGAQYHVQMQYGSIGWSVGATFGAAIGSKPGRRVISLIGDGSFQLTAQELSSMIRYKVNPIIFLMNNGGYTIEVEIHDGPYNNIQNWDYAGLLNIFNAGKGNGLGIRANTAGELSSAIKQALAHEGGPVLIECTLARDDCSTQLLEWGSRVAKANARI